MHKGSSTEDVLQNFTYLQYKHQGQGKNKTQKLEGLNFGSVRVDL